MKLPILTARWRAARLENQARMQRRALRDHARHECARIHQLEMRSRGLRLYVAWSDRRPKNLVVATSAEWHGALPHAA